MSIPSRDENQLDGVAFVDVEMALIAIAHDDRLNPSRIEFIFLLVRMTNESR